MVIQHNMTSSNANRQLGINTNNKKKTVERLSSGYRINRAADDAAGLSMSEKMRWSVRGLHQASRNIEDGSSLVQVADGGMNEIHAILQRQRELAVQAGNDTNTPAERNAIQQEINALSVEITRIANDTTFNSKHILNSEGNLIHGPVNADTSVMTLVSIPGTDTGSGNITGMSATNAEGSIQSMLLYGGNNARTSWMEIVVETGGNSYTMRTGSNTFPSANCVITNNILADGVESTFTYSDDSGNSIFELVRTMTKMANPSGNGGEVYKMDFAIKNLTGQAMTASIEMEFDVKFNPISGSSGSGDNPKFLMDNDVDETVIQSSIKYPDNNGHMPGIMNLYNEDNPYLNAQCIIDGYGATRPDFVKIGNYSQLLGSGYRDGQSIRDSGYAVGWENISLGAGGSSGTYTTMYGVSDPLRNPVLAGSHSTPVELNIQASDRAHTAITIPLVNCTAEKLGVGALSVMSFEDAGASLDKIDGAIDKVSEHRSTMGAIYNRLEKAKNNVDNIEENMQSAESRIRDTDMTIEMVEYSKHNILEQAGQSVLAQAGKMTEGVLELLQ